MFRDFMVMEAELRGWNGADAADNDDDDVIR